MERYNAMLNRLHRQLLESRGQIDQLVAAILETRLAEVKLADERRADERSGDTRTVLPSRHPAGLEDQLGDAAQARAARQLAAQANPSQPGADQSVAG